MGKYEITSGTLDRAKRVLVYGPEGIGKTTFVAGLLSMKNGRLIDTEDGSSRVDVARYPTPNTWSEMLDMINDAITDPDCGAVGIDTLDAAERLCAKALCSANGWDSVEDPGYGAGYKRNWEKFSELLTALDKCITAGKDVILTAHAAMRKFEQPDQMGSYDRWELKLQNSPKANIAALCKEWADMVLFANYQTNIITAPDGKTKKAAGGKRVMYTSHHPCWDAKNRFGMPEEMDFNFDAISSIFEQNSAKCVSKNSKTSAKASKTSAKNKEKAEVTVTTMDPPGAVQPDPVEENEPEPVKLTTEKLTGLPEKLQELMIRDQIFPIEIQAWTSKEGYYPVSVDIKNYDPEYLSEYLPSVWDSRIVPEVRDMRLDVPF